MTPMWMLRVGAVLMVGAFVLFIIGGGFAVYEPEVCEAEDG